MVKILMVFLCMGMLGEARPSSISIRSKRETLPRLNPERWIILAEKG